MINTKIKKAAAIAAITALTMTSAFAATQIGTGSVTGDATFDSVINWDDTFGGTANASGSVANILIQATVAPTLSMEISTGAINLGLLVAGVESTGNLDLEIGTNAVAGASITARSQSGGLTNTTDNTVKIQDNLNGVFDDSVDESYKFASAINAATDSTVSGFTQSATLDTEVNDDSTEHTVYTSDKPQATNGVNDVTFTVKATTDAQTPAGAYEDHVTFTVTGNF